MQNQPILSIKVSAAGAISAPVRNPKTRLRFDATRSDFEVWGSDSAVQRPGDAGWSQITTVISGGSAAFTSSFAWLRVKSKGPGRVDGFEEAGGAGLTSAQIAAIGSSVVAPDGKLTYPAGRPSDAEKAVVGALQAGRSASIVLIGDSTGVNLTKDDLTPTRWFLGGINRLLPYLPGVHVMYRAWVGNATTGTQYHNAWQVMQQGTLGQRHAIFTGATGAGNRTRSQDASQVGDFTGDIDFRVLVAPDDWTPASIQTIMARNGGVGFRGWTLKLAVNGDLSFNWNPNPAVESTITFAATAANVGGTDGVAQWLRVTLDLDNGAGGYTVTLYKSPATDGGVWTQIAQAVTTTGVTTLGNPTATPYEIGGRGAATEILTGKIYDVELRAGLVDGPIQNWLGIENWATPNANSEGGSPTLQIWISSLAGQNMTYFNDATRFPKLVPPASPAMYILNDSHNDTSLAGLTWFAVLDTWLTSMRARQPSAAIGVVVQNPEAATGTNISPNLPNLRMQQAGVWAIRNGLAHINLGAALMRAYPDGSAITASDGVHPTQAGYDAEAAAFAARLIGAL